ncbi:MAG: SDR family oxidoreductase [Alphaproteobacteria bacterium]|nr:SDR family oxidoreductase [Alphaproteobacteria bacterium]
MAAQTTPALPKAALITGGARRIGRAITEALVARGFAVAIHYHRSGEEALALVKSIQAQGGRAVALKADLSTEAEVSALMPRATEALGPIGLLINNASVFDYDAASTVTRASWDSHLETNFRAPFVLIQSLAQGLPNDAAGAVINLIDQRVWNLTPHFVSYTLSKAGLWTLTQTLALALAPRIRVNAIGPGPTLPSARQTPAQFAEQCARMPLKRGASTDEITAAMRFILDAPSMTGQMIALDGGQHLGWSQQADPRPEE